MEIESFESLIIGKKEKSILSTGKKNDDVDLVDILKVLIENSITQHQYTKKNILVFSAFKHDNEIMEVLEGVEKNLKNVDSKFLDKSYELAKEIAKTISITQKETRNPIMRYLKQ